MLAAGFDDCEQLTSLVFQDPELPMLKQSRPCDPPGDASSDQCIQMRCRQPVAAGTWMPTPVTLFARSRITKIQIEGSRTFRTASTAAHPAAHDPPDDQTIVDRSLIAQQSGFIYLPAARPHRKFGGKILIKSARTSNPTVLPFRAGVYKACPPLSTIARTRDAAA